MPIDRIILSTHAEFMALGMHSSSAYRRLRKGLNIDMGPFGANWRNIPMFPGYSASSCGLIRRHISGQGAHLGVLPAVDHHGGYVRYGLTIDGRVYSRLGHQLVMLTYVGPPPVEDYVVNHKNGIKSDNRVENLEWMSVEDNNLHAAQNGLLSEPKGELNPAAVLSDSDVVTIRNSSSDTWSLSVRYGVSTVQINKIKRHAAWSHIT